MNTQTGEIRWIHDDAPLEPGWIPICRKLKDKEKAEMQIRLYSPCGCGSGKKFKFCCKTTLKHI